MLFVINLNQVIKLVKKKSTFNFGISPRLKSKKARPFLNPFKLKPISKPKYVNQVKLTMPVHSKVIPKVPYKRTQPERSLIKKHPWGDKDGDGVPNWIDCKPFDRKKQGGKYEKIHESRITNKMPWGPHIPLKDKSGKKGSTKNIEYIGARSIFGVNPETAEVDESAITKKEQKKAWQNEYNLFKKQKRERTWLEATKEEAEEQGIKLVDKNKTIVYPVGHPKEYLNKPIRFKDDLMYPEEDLDWKKKNFPDRESYKRQLKATREGREIEGIDKPYKSDSYLYQDDYDEDEEEKMSKQFREEEDED
jgi:hypothetical protein